MYFIIARISTVLRPASIRPFYRSIWLPLVQLVPLSVTRKPLLLATTAQKYMCKRKGIIQIVYKEMEFVQKARESSLAWNVVCRYL